jgi:hypothetical protein
LDAWQHAATHKHHPASPVVGCSRSSRGALV